MLRIASVVALTLALSAPAPAQQQWYETGLLLPDPGEVWQQFGASVALSGDTILVGAPGAWGPIGGSFGAGSAHVYVLEGTEWVKEIELETPWIFSGANFGAAVDLDGDTAVLGAPLLSVSDSWQGGAVVFQRDAGVWTLESAIVVPDTQPTDQFFGSSIAVDGDTMVVGAPGADEDAAAGAGAVYVFVRDAGVWTQQARLVSPEPLADGAFGVDIDLDGDTLIVGEPGASPQPHLTQSGAARVFERVGTSWSLDETLLSADVAAFDGAGAVALDGDRAALGSPGLLGPGEVTTFVRQGGVWAEESYIFDLVWNGKGRSVDLDGDLLVTGTRAFITDGQRPGALLYDVGPVFPGVHPVAWARDGLNTLGGASLETPIFALAGDVLVMGNPLHDGEAEDAGLVHVFTRDGPWADLQHGLGGSGFPDPLLYAAGSLASPSDNVLLMAGTSSGGDAYVIASAVNLTVPFKGGVLVPAPDVIVGPLSLPTSLGETTDLAFHMPPGLPSGVGFFVQHWFADAGAPQGFAASNALSGTVP